MGRYRHFRDDDASDRAIVNRAIKCQRKGNDRTIRLAIDTAIGITIHVGRMRGLAGRATVAVMPEPLFSRIGGPRCRECQFSIRRTNGKQCRITIDQNVCPWRGPQSAKPSNIGPRPR